jgi:exopolysaccharide biosynthesis polyprenyl glycosylphosphotransferase
MLSFERSRVLLTDSHSNTAATLGIVPLDDLRLVPAPVQGEPLALRRRRSAVVVSDEVLHDPGAAAELAQLALLGVRFLRPREFYERNQRRVMLDGLDESWFLFERPLRPRRVYEAGKRVVDILLGMIGALLVLLVAPLLWLLYRFDDHGPVFFRQERVGRYGESFMIWKFRTMRVDAEAAGPVWAVKNDARVTRIGALLRKTRLDEMPQFFNVLSGEMSIIGPRPERPVFVRTLGRAIPFYDRRHLMRPGITGWATVRFGYGDSVTDKWRSHEYDLYYLKHRSPLLDVEILLRTVVVILLRRGQ